jgi:hypothetical protein
MSESELLNAIISFLSWDLAAVELNRSGRIPFWRLYELGFMLDPVLDV